MKVSPAFARSVKAVIRPESKYLYTSITRNLVSFVSPFSENLDDMKQGTGASLRVGNVVTPTVLYGNLTVIGTHDGDAEKSAAVRAVLLQYHDDQQDAPFDPAIVLESQATPGGPFNVSNKGRFTVLWSKFMNISMRRDNSQFIKTCEMNIPLKNRKKPLFDGALVKKHHYWFLVFTDAQAAGDDIKCQMRMQLRYTDT